MPENIISANARIPTRPLSTDNKELAQPKELLVDYKKHEIYVCDIDGKLVNVTASVTSVVEEVMKNIEDDPTLVTESTISLPSGETITIEQALIDSMVDIEDLMEALGATRDEEGNIILNLEISAEDINTNNNNQFVSKEEKESWNSKTDIIKLSAVISSNESKWVAIDNKAPYIQTISISEIKETDCPFIDVVLSEDYEISMKELKSYSNIYKILTHNGNIEVFSSKPTEIDLTIVMKIDR